MGKSLSDIETGKLETRFSKYFKGFSKALKGFTIVLSAAGTAVLGYKLYTDFRDDAPMYTKILDSIQVICELSLFDSEWTRDLFNQTSEQFSIYYEY